MKRVAETAGRTFVVLPADWPLWLALQYLERAEFTHVVVVSETPPAYVLLTRAEATDALKAQARLPSATASVAPRDIGEATVAEAFVLQGRAATPVLDPSADAPRAPRRGVVVREGRVVGFVDSGAKRAELVKGGGTSGTGRFSAFPALDAPAQVAPGVAFEILVGFRKTADSAVAGKAVVVDEPVAGAECQIVLIPDGIVLDRNHASLPLRDDIAVRFTGRANAGRAEATLTAEFLYDGQPIGWARRVIRVALAGDMPAGPPAKVRRSPCWSAAPETERYVDLKVTVLHGDDGKLSWTFSGPIPLPLIPGIGPFVTRLEGPRDFAAKLLVDLKTEEHTGPGAENIVRDLGQRVARLMPDEFFQTLRLVRDVIGQTPKVLLITDANLVPWELALLEKPLDTSAPPYLGCQADVGRWLYDDHVALPPPVSVDVKRFFAVASGYGLGTDLSELAKAENERDTLKKEWQAIALKADRTSLNTLIDGQPQADVVHFAVHGVSDPTADNQTLLMADGTRRQATAMIGDYRCGETPRFAFVFLNACQVGTPGETLGATSGFPGVMVGGGARGFIAPLWEVDDTLASQFALDFYRETLGAKKPVAEVLQSLRGMYKHGGHTTPLAYIYYGNPSLRLSFTPPHDKGGEVT